MLFQDKKLTITKASLLKREDQCKNNIKDYKSFSNIIYWNKIFERLYTKKNMKVIIEFTWYIIKL